MAEQFANRAQSTLTTAVTAGDTSWILADGSLFSSSANFSLLIEHPTDGTYEYAIGTNKASNTLTVTRNSETSVPSGAKAFPIGSTVTQLATKRQMDLLAAGANPASLTGTDAAKTPALAGQIYLPNNGFQLYRDTAAAFAPWGPVFPFTAPVDGDYAWINQGSAAVSTTKGGINLSVAANGGASWRIRKKAIPAAPYTVTVGFISQGLGGFTGNALLLREAATGELHTINVSGTGVDIGVNKWTSPSAFSAAYATVANGMHGFVGAPMIFFQISDDGVNRISRVSKDGQNFVQIHSVGNTDFLTPDEIGFATFDNATYTNGMTLLHWSQS